MLKKLLVHRTESLFVQFFRYGIVVAVTAPIDLGGYILLVEVFHWQAVLSATISFTVSLVVNYLMSIVWVFNSHSGRQKKVDATLFMIIGFVGLLLTDLVIWILTDLASINKIVAKLVAFVVVFFWSFGARRYIFRTNLTKWRGFIAKS